MNLPLTIIAALILMAFVIAALGIGLLLTGKSRLRKRCGYVPKSGESTCQICGDKKVCKPEEKDECSDRDPT